MAAPVQFRVRGAVHAGGAERAHGEGNERGHHGLPEVRDAGDGEGRGGALPGRDSQAADSEQASPAGEAEHHADGAAGRAHDGAEEAARGAPQTGRNPGTGQQLTELSDEQPGIRDRQFR